MLLSDDDLADRIRKLRLMVFDFDGVFTDNSVYVFEDGREAVCCSRFDGIGIRRLERAGITPFIISTEVNGVVAARAKKLQMECLHGVERKLEALRRVAARFGVSLAETGYVGNDINDKPCLKHAGLPIVVADAHDHVRDLACYITTRPGGKGAVREICDLIGDIRGTPPAYEDE
ncbi:3-deoxy-D-manno-octulosonate 8-phosphate phosphatase (KDO 8-P phosphatase) [Rhodopseudomonas thermotolerans]|uniref:3-deoxy-D-manno-octulosonate 8-phosphate phosphatase (KDO 8-P phosphatase) n=2 Tax=Rhodopseudomonas TaxID=1073 RepID=A0A336JK33_9BRAD|nr:MULTISPECIES: HAD hydrolase family protein [Rhodopseudomonas]RED37990.1 3-deoxy-D-manno-octulosonate 8-phosphate phosphatase (KDO 8-P phosphatase) [Rhodopseudomonas pentothenatexigens]REG05183.1 3-deoxy-D-manno-octulosonate 8-phosphate phosphatase (KDO 8-P phosphatase) [Rhodopseudomonas thermotolerans]SSW90015.1 3-deoxy-D-manno-octulosonate 8-phosphate phosphatase (KDO 8-P phosphatase) [Rhodopseudomonas pentothenatexigens]